MAAMVAGAWPGCTLGTARALLSPTLRLLALLLLLLQAILHIVGIA